MKFVFALSVVTFSCWNVESFAPARVSSGSMNHVLPTVASTLMLDGAKPKMTVPGVSRSKTQSKLHMTSAATVASDDNSEGKDVAAAAGGGEGTMSALMFNLVKSIVGAGVLSLPAGEFFLLLFQCLYLCVCS